MKHTPHFDDGDPRTGARSATLAWTLSLAYTLVIAYASLQPLIAWRLPAADLFSFVTAPWPHYVTLGDLIVNTAAYVPLGFLLAIALSGRRSAARAVFSAAVLGALLSLTMETLQMFLPQRISSNVDLLTNGAGALVGAMAAPLLSPSGFPGRRLAAWRTALFVPGRLADAGLVLAGLWLLTHLHPTAQLLGTGNLRSTFDLPAYFIHTPGRLISAEATVVFLNMTGVGLLIAGLTRDGVARLRIIAIVLSIGLCIKIAASVLLFSASGPLVWLTPGVSVGLIAGAVCLVALIKLPRTAREIIALICLACAVVAINFAPENPYHTVPPKLTPGAATHLLRFSNIVRALSELWPFLAVAFLIAAASVEQFARPHHANAANTESRTERL